MTDFPRFPGYELLDLIGSGGLGRVCKARQLSTNRFVALKTTLLNGLSYVPRERARFQCEVEALACLSHPNIVPLFEAGESDAMLFSTMELCEGGSLSQKCKGKPLSVREAARIVETLAQAMHCTHEHGVIHRNLKPSTILFSADGTLKVAGFGLARKLDAPDFAEDGSIVGTAAYMAPEQAAGRNKEVGPPADIYALGGILYVLLTGGPPFQAATPLETLLQVREQEPVPPHRLTPGVPRDLEAICLKCLAKEPSRRYASAAALADDLGRFPRGQPISARRVSRSERIIKWVRRNAFVAATVAAMLLLLVAGAAVTSMFALQTDRRTASARLAEEQIKQGTRDLKARETLIAERERESAEEARLFEQRSKEENAKLKRASQELYALLLEQAQSAFAKGSWEEAMQYLERCARNLRGWEYQHLRTRFHAGTLLGEHTSLVTSVAISPDGKRLVTDYGDKTLKVWDADTGQEIRSLKGHSRRVHCVAISSDGKRLVSGSRDNTLKVWDVDKGQELFSLEGHSDDVNCVAISPDAKRIVSGCNDGRAKVWDAEEGQELLTLKGHTKTVLSVAFSPDGTFLVTGSEDTTAKVWEANKR
jgi:serine/threonine protein kinase